MAFAFVAPLPLARARLAHLSALAAVSIAAPLVGRQVTISGLNSRPELNGKQGLAIAFHDDKGRYNVRLQSTRQSCSSPQISPQPTAAAEAAVVAACPDLVGAACLDLVGAACPDLAGLACQAWALVGRRPPHCRHSSHS